MTVSRADIFQSSIRLDEAAFEAMFREHYAKVYAVLFRLTGDRFEADDLAAETFWRLWERPPGKSTNIAGWLYRVATNLGYNRLRARSRQQHYETASMLEEDQRLITGSNLQDPARETEQRQERQRVRAVLQQMPLRDVQVLVLRHSGLSYKEIADAAGTAPASIGKLLARAEAKFEALYRKGEKDAPER